MHDVIDEFTEHYENTQQMLLDAALNAIIYETLCINPEAQSFRLRAYGHDCGPQVTQVNGEYVGDDPEFIKLNEKLFAISSISGLLYTLPDMCSGKYVDVTTRDQAITVEDWEM